MLPITKETDLDSHILNIEYGSFEMEITKQVLPPACETLCFERMDE